jgi:hypothetical protein
LYYISPSKKGYLTIEGNYDKSSVSSLFSSEKNEKYCIVTASENPFETSCFFENSSGGV